MKKTLQLLLLAALVAGAWLGYRWLNPGDVELIRRQLTGLVETASFSADESDIAKLAKVNGLREYLTSDVVLRVNRWNGGAVTLSGYQQLRDAALTARQAADVLEIEFSELQTTVAADGLTATSGFVVEVRGGPRGESQVQELKAEWTKADGSWRLREVQTVEAIYR